MITDEQILEIASSYLRELYSGDVGDVVWQPLREDALLKFAQRVAEIEYERGYDDGCYRATNSTGLVGDPQ